jgi:trehalose 6-phosphate phosphatase
MAELPPLPRGEDRWALFLDVDGTLVPIAETPDAVRVGPGVPALLRRLQAGCQGALALVSGRALAQLDALFAPLMLPAAALHGQERRRADGAVRSLPVPQAALSAMRLALAAYAAARPGLVLEDKGSSLALHYRLAPRQGGAVRRLARDLAAGQPLLRLVTGRKVAELVPAGVDKGRAIAAFLAESPFAGRMPVFAGDDSTDEDGFAEVNRLGGLSIKVASRETSGKGRSLDSAARYHVSSVAGLQAWLRAVADRLDPAQSAALAGGGGTPRLTRALS